MGEDVTRIPTMENEKALIQCHVVVLYCKRALQDDDVGGIGVTLMMLTD